MIGSFEELDEMNWVSINEKKTLVVMNANDECDEDVFEVLEFLLKKRFEYWFSSTSDIYFKRSGFE